MMKFKFTYEIIHNSNNFYKVKRYMYIYIESLQENDTVSKFESIFDVHFSNVNLRKKRLKQLPTPTNLQTLIKTFRNALNLEAQGTYQCDTNCSHKS